MSEEKITIKISPCSGFDITNEIEKYVNSIIDDISVQGYVIKEDGVVFYDPTTHHDAKAFIDRILDDYAVAGYSLNCGVDLYDLNVYTSDPELNMFYINQRMNISQTQTEALSDLLVETNSDISKLDSIVCKMDTTLTLNGVYKLRDLIAVVADGLSEKGVFIADDLNKIVSKTIH
jgi:hypothetical protein